MYEVRRTAPLCWTVGIPAKDGAFYHARNFMTKPNAKKYAAYLNAKIARAEAMKEARNNYRNRTRTTMQKRNRPYVYRRKKRSP